MPAARVTPLPPTSTFLSPTLILIENPDLLPWQGKNVFCHYKHNGHQLFWNWLTSETLQKRGHFPGQDALRPPYMLAPYGRSKVAFGKQTVCNFNITSSSETFWEGCYFYSPLDGMLVHRRVERGTVRVKCLAHEHNTMSPARSWTWTARSRV